MVLYRYMFLNMFVTLILIILKLFTVINWNWWFVTLPFSFGVLLPINIVAFIVLFAELDLRRVYSNKY